MKFEDALKAARLGKAIKGKDWKVPIILEHKFFYITGGEVYLSMDEILNNDWEIIEDQPK